MANQKPKYKPFKIASRTTIFPRYERELGPIGIIYRLDTYRARVSPVDNLQSSYRCVYIKAEHIIGLQGCINSPKPVERSLVQYIKFFLFGPAKPGLRGQVL